MKKDLLVLNNPIFINQIEIKYDQIYYAPIFQSQIQKDFFYEIYLSIKKTCPRIIWTEFFEPERDYDVLSWNSVNEKKVFETKILSSKNRLFDDLPFEVTESFTNFKKKAEPLLPSTFSKACPPFHKVVIDDIHYYFENKKLASTYFDTRNGLVGRNFSTKFSKYLSTGTLDVRYLYNQVKKYEQKYGANKSTYWIIFELLWREFFYWHYQKHNIKYFSENGLKGALNFSPFKIYTHLEMMNLVKEPFMIAALNELEFTGYLSNRVRQIFASQWINDLSLNWRSGAFYFEQRLIDYDVYSNYGNWMYLAGVGVDPRGKRYFNLDKQLQNYDPESLYTKKWC